MLKTAMDYKHHWRLQAHCICKKMTGLWGHSNGSVIAARTAEPLILYTNISGTGKPSRSLRTKPKFCSATSNLCTHHPGCDWARWSEKGGSQTAATASPGCLQYVLMPWGWWHLNLIWISQPWGFLHIQAAKSCYGSVLQVACWVARIYPVP